MLKQPSIQEVILKVSISMFVAKVDDDAGKILRF